MPIEIETPFDFWEVEMEDPELKPCPFDAEEVTLRSTAGSWGYYNPKWYVECTSCSVHGKMYEDAAWGTTNDDGSSQKAAKAAAADWWNRRP